MDYEFSKIEKKWIKFWDEHKTFKTEVKDFNKPKFYALDMFPYPSGQGLHVGHPEGYTATDVVSRMKRMQGYNVLHPMGFDSFGLPAEQYAIKTGNHPGEFTQKNIDNFIYQLKMLGFSYDWDRVISTADPSYYKWTQWIFKQLFLDGYAQIIDTPVNWCEELGTVLANDEVIDGKSERGGYPVVRKNMKQWVITIPSYAERLLEGLEGLDWEESSKTVQKNWIGKSVGAKVDFKVKGTDEKFTVFTTRCDTLFGATYCVLSPEHQLVDKITTKEQQEKVKEYQKICAGKSDLERTELNKEKTGVWTGAYAINPVNNKEIPIFISDYVLTSYGTGAIMAVPAHDQRDYDFAKKFGLEIIQVLDGGDISQKAFTEDGVHINSDFLNGLNKQDAINKMLEWLEKNCCGQKTTTYKLRNWVFARQRYWGEPVPIVYDENGTPMALPDDDLPLELPELDDYKSKNGQPPLENAQDWKYVKIDGKTYKRETATMPGSAGSSWYFLRYIDPHNDKKFADYDLMKYWLPVDLYVGGTEHLVGHLLYSRFWNNYLYDKGLVPVKEPFKKLVHQGMILGENGEKMSKSKGNVINPNDIVAEYGADALRMYEMFMGALKDAKPWNTQNIEGIKRFLNRIFRLYFELDYIRDCENKTIEKVYNQTVKIVTEDYENLSINTAISQMMIFVNAVYKEECLPTEMAKGFVKLLNPVCPFITEEIWNVVFKNDNSIAYEQWPVYDESKIKDDTIEIVAQVNSKIVAKINLPNGATQQEATLIAMQNEKLASLLLNKTVVKTIYVPNRLINFIAK
ncbi:MAG: leucine--tRNA ligase [Christensenellales bacterium]